MKDIKVLLFFALLLFCLKVSPTNGQQMAEIIEGVVYNSNQEPIEKATVHIKGTDSQIRSDQNGRFLLQKIALGTVLSISAEGYMTIHKKVDTFGKIYALLYQPEEVKREQETFRWIPISRSEQIFTAVEKQSTFPGGTVALYRFINENTHYPEEARKAKIEGRVFAQFVVHKDGTLGQKTILKGLGYGCEEEVLRVLDHMPKWNPGKENGRTVNVWYTLPFSFSLSDSQD